MFGFCVSRLGGAHHPVPAREGMVVVPVVVIVDATKPVAEAAIWVVIMLARRSSTGGVRLKNPASRCSRTPHRVNPSKNKFFPDAPQKRDFTTLRSPIAKMR
ncbi:hypothetical protein D3C86_1330460 [compost metagenome]